MKQGLLQPAHRKKASGTFMKIQEAARFSAGVGTFYLKPGLHTELVPTLEWVAYVRTLMTRNFFQQVTALVLELFSCLAFH